MREPQTLTKRVKVPATLKAEGWRLEGSDTVTPFNLVNDRLNLTTGEFSHIDEAVGRAREMMIEAAERQAIAEEGTTASEPSNGDRPPVVAAPDAWRPLELEKIRLDGGTQHRALFADQVVQEYADAMRAGVKFPPVEVISDGTNFWLTDGFYRCRAAAQLGHAWIEANISVGTQRDAVLVSVGVNSTHGQPRTNADKRHAVLVMLEDPEWSTWSDSVIADYANVSQPFVSRMRREFEAETDHGERVIDDDGGGAGVPPIPRGRKRRGKDNRITDTARIGKSTEDQPGAQTDDRQMEISEIAGAGGGLSTTDDQAKAITWWCSKCGAEKTDADYRNKDDQCFKCTAKKKTREPLDRSKGGPLPGPPTLSEIRGNRELMIRLQWKRNSSRLTVNLVLKDGHLKTYGLHVDQVPTLPAKLLELIGEALKTRRPKLPDRKPAAHKLKIGPAGGAYARHIKGSKSTKTQEKKQSAKRNGKTRNRKSTTDLGRTKRKTTTIGAGHKRASGKRRGENRRTQPNDRN